MMCDNSRGPIDTDSTMTSLGRPIKENVLPAISSTTHPIVKQHAPMGWVDWEPRHVYVVQYDVIAERNDLCGCVHLWQMEVWVYGLVCELIVLPAI